jgi:hypothetical protein
MRIRTLFIYMVVLAGLAVYYYYFEIYSPVYEDNTHVNLGEIFSLDTSGIEEISIQGMNYCRLLKKDSTWWITTPIENPADSSEIESLFRAISTLRAQRYLHDIKPLSDFGLDPAMLKLNFKVEDKEFFLNIGCQTPTKQYCYAFSSTRDDIFLIHSYEKPGFDKDVFTLRDKRLFSVNFSDVGKINIKRHGFILEFAKDSDGRWQLSKDPSKKVKTARVNELVSSLCRLEAQAYPEEVSLTGDPDITIEISAEGIAQSLQIWQMAHQEENMYALSAFQTQPVQIHDSILTVIPNDLMEVIDRSIIELDSGRVVKIVVLDDSRHVLENKQSLWYLDGQRMEDAWIVGSILETLDELEYEDLYMKLPDDIQKHRSLQIFYDRISPVFDIGMYSQYYVAVGDSIYQIHEGGMKSLYDSLDLLVKKQL